ncbi:hypothetical protein ACJX0J_007140 [Zea mays]
MFMHNTKHVFFRVFVFKRVVTHDNLDSIKFPLTTSENPSGASWPHVQGVEEAHVVANSGMFHHMDPLQIYMEKVNELVSLPNKTERQQLIPYTIQHLVPQELFKRSIITLNRIFGSIHTVDTRKTLDGIGNVTCM